MANSKKDSLDEIIHGCIHKHKKSQEMLYKHFYGYALSVAMIYTRQRNDAIEIVDDSFVKVFSEIEKFDLLQPFKGWLRKIIINTSIDHFRRNTKHNHIADVETSHIEDGAPGVINNLTAQDIMLLLNQLPPIHKLVFCLYEIEGFNHEEIARQLNIPGSSSRVYLTRAKKQLREMFPVYFNSDQKKYGN